MNEYRATEPPNAPSRRPEEPLERARALIDAGQSAKAVEVLLGLTADNPDSAEAFFFLGTALSRSGRLAEGLSAFNSAARLAPRNPNVWRNIGICHGRLAQYDEAHEALGRAQALDPDNPAREHDLALIDIEAGDDSSARARLESLLQRAPGHAGVKIALGRLLLRVGEPTRALEHLEPALAHMTNDNALRLEVARGHRQVGHLDKAEKAYREALRVQPGSVNAHIGFALVRTAQGRPSEAADLYRMALAIEPKNVAALGNLARLHKFESGDPLIGRMIGLVGQPSLPTPNRILLEYAIGKALDDIGDHEGAFAHFECANDLSAPARPYDHRATISFVDRTVQAFDAEYFEDLRGRGASSELPVFIVGMGRSGTSLAEQILASHQSVFGAGELMEIETLARSAAETSNPSWPFDPQAFATLDRAATGHLGLAYIDRLRAFDPSALRVVDKMPLNFQNLGVIAAILPQARIIHCRRDPRDTCFSLYVQHFADSQPYTHDLRDLGTYYREYVRLMAHWRNVLPLPMLELDYESVVTDLGSAARRLIDFCGLPWDERCLRFHETERPVLTASVWQVRQPIHTRSVGRWRNYEAHIGPLLDALGS